MSEPLIGGSRDASYLAYDPTPYLGRLTDAQDESVSCSAVIIAPDWVLSAAHCAGIGRPVYRGARGVAQRVLAVESHDSQDVALFQLEPAACDGAPAEDCP